MPAAIHEPILFWQVYDPPVRTRDGASQGPHGPRSHPADQNWRSPAFTTAVPTREKRRATRYEKFTTRMVLLSAVITFGVTLTLHLANYGLETRTSSTSGTHSTFYKDDE